MAFSSSTLLFFLLRRQPPRPTLFPYTTLFRSTDRHRLQRVASNDPEDTPAATKSVASGTCSTGPVRARGAIVTKDRKSTRLNSSHVRISYAVFCLKKKSEPSVFSLASLLQHST